MIKLEDNIIYLTRGDSAVFEIDLRDEKDDEYQIQEDDVIRFAMAKKYADGNPLIIKEVDHETRTVEIDPEDTKELPFGTYVYDVEVTDGYGHVSTVLLSKLKLTKEVY